MTINLPTELQRFVDEQVAAGVYASAEEVVAAGLATLRQSEKFGDFPPGHLDALLEKGERSLERGGAIDAQDVFEGIRQLSTEHGKERP